MSTNIAPGQFHVTENLRLWLRGPRIVEPTDGPAGWFSERFSLFRKQIETLPISEFTIKLADFLTAVELKNVVFVEVDSHTVYSDEGKIKEKTHDLSMAVGAIQSFLSSGNHQHNHLVFFAVGEEQDLHLIVQAEYSQKHPHNTAPFQININGIPSAAMLKESETEDEYWLRMARLSVAEDNSANLANIGAVSEHYLSVANKIFDIEKAEKVEVSMKW